MMTVKTAALAAALAASALAGGTAAASAQDAYRPLTVARPHRAAVAPTYVPPALAPAYDPYHGPAVLVTGPIGLASDAVALPFRVLGSVFPARGDNPLVLIGAPIYFAGQVAQFPFRVAQAPFGGPNPFAY